MQSRSRSSLPLVLAALIASCQGSMQPSPTPGASLEVVLSSPQGSPSQPITLNARVVNDGPVPLHFERCSQVRWSLEDAHGASIDFPYPVVDCAPPLQLALAPNTEIAFPLGARFEGQVYCPGTWCPLKPGTYTMIARFAFHDPPLEVRGSARFEWVAPDPD